MNALISQMIIFLHRKFSRISYVRKRSFCLFVLLCIIASVCGCGSDTPTAETISLSETDESETYSEHAAENTDSTPNTTTPGNSVETDQTATDKAPGSTDSDNPPDSSDDFASGSHNDTSSDDAGLTNPVTLLRPRTQVRGIYITGPVAGSERMQELVQLVESTKLNTMVIDIKNDEGNITYDMNLPADQNPGASIRYIRDMPALIEELHEKEIYVIGRIVCFKDPVLSAGKPDLALCKPDGEPIVDANGLAWVNPYKEEVWDYLCTIAECASADGFDEIQFDYIRYPIGSDADEADYGVDTDTYTREMGLNDFFSYTAERLHKKKIIFGADLFGTVIGSDTDRDRTGQNYLSIAGSCDVLSPMIYPSHYAAGTFKLDVPDAHPYETIFEALELSKEVLSGQDSPGTQQAVIRPWLQCFNAIWVSGHITYDSEQIADQIRAVYATGYQEWILWNASNHYEQVADALALLQDESDT